MQSADHIFLEGLWQEPDLPKTSKLNDDDNSSHRSQDRNEVTFETKILDAVSN